MNEHVKGSLYCFYIDLDSYLNGKLISPLNLIEENPSGLLIY